jgi:hypothetical protein
MATVVTKVYCSVHLSVAHVSSALRGSKWFPAAGKNLDFSVRCGPLGHWQHYDKILPTKWVGSSFFFSPKPSEVFITINGLVAEGLTTRFREVFNNISLWGTCLCLRPGGLGTVGSMCQRMSISCEQTCHGFEIFIATTW